MKIGIDASRAFVNNPTGTERYSYEVITRLIQLPEAKNHEWVLYTRENIRLPYLWTQVGLAARTWMDNLDVLWVPAHTLPVFRRPGLKTVVTVHGIEYEWLPEYENWLQRWYLPLSTQYAVHSATKIIAVSEFTKKQLVERLGADPKKITVVHEGVGQTSNKFKIQRQKYILFIGTVQPRKNLKRLIDAFRSLKIKNLKLVICGKLGWGYEELPIDKYDNIKFLRYVSDKERDILLRNALVYVQPSITEGFGLPVLEAFAAGVPVVSSKGGALSEVVGEAGVLFDPFNVEDISHKLALVIDSYKLREKLIKKGRKRAKEFSWDKAAKETYNILVSAKG